MAKPFMLLNVVFLCFVLSFTSMLQAQNLMDSAHSVRFLNHLLQTKQYRFAGFEIERLLFLHSTDTLQALLLQSLRLDGNLVKAFLRGNQLKCYLPQTKEFPASEYLKTLLLTSRFDSVSSVLKTNSNLNNIRKDEIALQSMLLQKKWKEVLSFKPHEPDSFMLKQYLPIAAQRLAQPRKNAGVALCLSALIPGSGKVYTGWWKDGLMSFLTIGIASYQAYSGFSKKGVKSGFGWFFTGVGATFYFSNIYGSWKSAKIYNKNKDDEAIEKTKQMIMN